MKSAIYEGNVIHSRLEPTIHQFNYKICYFFLDLNQASKLVNIPFLLKFDSKNYLNIEQIKTELQNKFEDASINKIKNVFILTQLSYLGFCFNPVSFYYCYGENDELLYIISQITNTPWGEKHINCFEVIHGNGHFIFKKDFHVSPFMPMDIIYHWKFKSSPESINIEMSNRLMGSENPFFYVQMNLLQKQLSRINVWKAFFEVPLMSFKTITAIYWQALLLYLKRNPFYAHPKKEGAL